MLRMGRVGGAGTAVIGFMIGLSALVPIHVEWLAARMALGRWPRVLLDDPKYIPTAWFHEVVDSVCGLATLSVIPVGVLWAISRSPRMGFLFLGLSLGNLAGWSVIISHGRHGMTTCSLRRSPGGWTEQAGPRSVPTRSADPVPDWRLRCVSSL